MHRLRLSAEPSPRHIRPRIDRVFYLKFFNALLIFLVEFLRNNDLENGKLVTFFPDPRSTPRDLIRSFDPLLAPGGMVMVTGPSRVGTCTFVPSIAS